jgi:hypothetical protein
VFTPTYAAALQRIGLLQWFVPRRRKLLPTLTRNDDGSAPIGSLQGVEVEYFNGDEWLPAGNWGLDLLESEAGVMLTGERVPEALLDLRTDAQMRVTATIETDFRITAVARRLPDSDLAFDATAQIDLETEFHWRQVSSLSKYYGRATPLEADDRSRLLAFVGHLRDRFDQVDVAGTPVLEGVDHHDFNLGDRIAGVRGRNISYRARSRGGAHPQIIGITYDIESQKTILQLEQSREFVAG